MDLPIVDMEEERSRRAQQPVRLAQARLQEGEIVVERIREGRAAEANRSVARALVTGPVAVRVANRPGARSALRAPSIERRVDIDQAERFVGEPG